MSVSEELRPAGKADPKGIQNKFWQGWPWTEIGVLAFYVGLAIITTWPMLLNFTTSVPDGSIEDRYQNLWNFWWIDRAVSHFQNPFQTDMLFYPWFSGGATTTLPLHLHTLQLFNGLAMLPLTKLFGVAAAYNGLIIYSFSLSGLGAFLLGRHITRNLWAGILAGVLYGFSSLHFGHVVVSITNIMSIQWLPFYALMLLLWHEQRKLKWAGGAAVFLAISAYTDFYNTFYIVLYTAFFYLVTSFPRSWLKQLLGPAIALAGGLLLSAFIVIPAALELNGKFYFAQLDPGRDLRASYNLMDIFGLAKLESFLVWLVVLGGGLLLIISREWRKTILAWYLLFIGCIILSLGPRLQISRTNGQVNPTDIPLPYALIKLIPGASVSRAPNRFDIPEQLAFAILGAIIVTFLGQQLAKLPRLNSRKVYLNGILGGGLALLYVLAVNPVPLDMARVQPSNFVNKLPKIGSYTVLELPITRHYNFDHERMLNQIFYQQPIMGGYLARPVYDPYRDINSPFLYLADQRYFPEGAFGDPAKDIYSANNGYALLDQMLKLYNFQYVAIYKDDYRFERERVAIRNLLNKELGQDALIYEDEHNLLYKTPSSLTQSPGVFLGDGWYGVEQNGDGSYRWINQQADIYLTVSQAGQVKISLSAQAFGGDRQIRISSGGKLLFEGLVTPAPAPIEFSLDATPGTQAIRLESLSPAQTGKETGLANDIRPLAFLIRNLVIGVGG